MTIILPLLLSFIFGTIVGSFLNVVAIRFKTGMGVKGRSKCMSCGVQLGGYELIPLVSFFVQKGACRKCRSKVSWQYPLVEFIAGVLFALIFILFPPVTPAAAVQTLIYIVASCFLLVIAVYDIKHTIIPDEFVYTFIGLTFVGMFIGGASWWHVPGFYHLIAGPLLAVPFALLWLVSRGNWMGFGDVKLVIGIGWLLGLSGGVNALVLSFWIATVVSLVWLFSVYKKFKPKTQIPFGPYLIVGMYLVLLFGIQVIDIDLLKVILVSYL